MVFRRQKMSIVTLAIVWAGMLVGVGGFLIFLSTRAFVTTPWVGILSSLGGALLAVGLVSVFMEVRTHVGLFEAFSLFGDHKSLGILRIFMGTKDDDYIQAVRQARGNSRSIKILTLIGGEWVAKDEYLQQTKDMIDRCNEFVLLVTNTSSEGFWHQYRYFEPLRDMDVRGLTQRSEISARHAELKNHVAQMGVPEKKYVGQYNAKTVYKLEFYDNRLFVHFYGRESRGVYSPVMLVEKRSGDSLWKYFEAQFDSYKKDAKYHDDTGLSIPDDREFTEYVRARNIDVSGMRELFAELSAKQPTLDESGG